MMPSKRAKSPYVKISTNQPRNFSEGEASKLANFVTLILKLDEEEEKNAGLSSRKLVATVETEQNMGQESSTKIYRFFYSCHTFFDKLTLIIFLFRGWTKYFFWWK